MYDRELIGNIINVVGLTFYNTITKKYEPDHAYKSGRPCLLIYSDEKYDYFLPLTGKNNVKYSEEKYSINKYSYKYLYEYPSSKEHNDKKRDLNSYVKMDTVYKKPVCGYGFREIGKLKYSEYKNIIKAFKEFHNVSRISETLESAILIRKWENN